MNLSRVTLTGADDSINPERLFELSTKYSFAEWGILLSRHSGGNNRFPSKTWRDRLESLDAQFFDFEMQYAGHLCGTWVKELLKGNTKFVSEIGDLWEVFQRIQINTHGIEHEYDEVGLLNALAQFPDKEFIFQYDNANSKMLDFVVANSEISVSTLFDLSHGAGELPKEWPLPLKGIECGYAGGLSPENIKEQMELIAEKVGSRQVWVDMETRLRSNNDRLFDLKKCELVLEICSEFATT